MNGGNGGSGAGYWENGVWFGAGGGAGTGGVGAMGGAGGSGKNGSLDGFGGGGGGGGGGPHPALRWLSVGDGGGAGRPGSSRYQVWIHAREPMTLAIIGSVLAATFNTHLEAEVYNEKLNLREFGPTAFGPWVLCRSSLFHGETRALPA